MTDSEMAQVLRLYPSALTAATTRFVASAGNFLRPAPMRRAGFQCRLAAPHRRCPCVVPRPDSRPGKGAAARSAPAPRQRAGRPDAWQFGVRWRPDVVADHAEHGERHARITEREHLVGINGGLRPVEAAADRRQPELLRPLEEYAAPPAGSWRAAGYGRPWRTGASKGHCTTPRKRL